VKRKTVCWSVLIFLVAIAGVVQAQLIAVDDTFGVPVAQELIVEAPGVLENDTYNGEPAEDAGATVELVTGPLSGMLECGSNPGLELCPDGSFTFTPGVGFSGSDSFTYRAMVGIETEVATATLTACQGGPTVFVCWKHAEYMAKLDELGYGSFFEGFEDDLAWGAARSPDTAPSVISQGITWESNHPDRPAANEITTGSGPARTGLWGVFDPEHGYATGTVVECDVDEPPEHCLHKDGLTGIRQNGESPLVGIGGFFTGAAVPKLVAIIDGGVPVNLGGVPLGFQFYGVIDTRGFEIFLFEERDGKIGQARYVFADDFTIGTKLSEIFFDGFESGDTSFWSSQAP
jgi:hypothetical protein